MQMRMFSLLEGDILGKLGWFYGMEKGKNAPGIMLEISRKEMPCFSN